MEKIIVKTSDDGRYRVSLVNDPDGPNPREEYEQIVYAVTIPGSLYVDVPESGPLSEGWERIKDRADAVEVFERWARIFRGAVTLHDTPARGADAVWYILPEGAAEVPDPRAALKSARDEYRAWAEGEVYGCIIEEAVDWHRADGRDGDDMTTWEEVEDGSCWGLIGYGWAEEEAEREFAAFLADETAGN